MWSAYSAAIDKHARLSSNDADAMKLYGLWHGWLTCFDAEPTAASDGVRGAMRASQIFSVVADDAVRIPRRHGASVELREYPGSS